MSISHLVLAPTWNPTPFTNWHKQLLSGHPLKRNLSRIISFSHKPVVPQTETYLEDNLQIIVTLVVNMAVQKCVFHNNHQGLLCYCLASHECSPLVSSTIEMGDIGQIYRSSRCIKTAICTSFCRHVTHRLPRNFVE